MKHSCSGMPDGAWLKSTPRPDAPACRSPVGLTLHQPKKTRPGLKETFVAFGRFCPWCGEEVAK